ncbi:MAG TPA: alfa-L-rhamnosidase, partial [bacterium]|nr:alfa-L-rhamnosidase [bacterium]
MKNIIVLTFGALAFFMASAAGADGSLAVRDLRCEYQSHPLAVDAARPRLSWILDAERRNQSQTAYQVLVSGSRENLDRDKGDLWDSGKVASDRSIQVEYAGKPLASYQQCFWKVQVWDVNDQPSAWSEP